MKKTLRKLLMVMTDRIRSSSLMFHLEEEDYYSMSTDTDTLRMKESSEYDYDNETQKISKKQSKNKNLHLEAPERLKYLEDSYEYMTEKERKEAKKARKKDRKRNKLKAEAEAMNQIGFNQNGTPEKKPPAETSKNQKTTPNKENGNINSINAASGNISQMLV